MTQNDNETESVSGLGDEFFHGYVPGDVLDIHPDLSLHTKSETNIDPITYEVLRHRLWTINQNHGQTIENVSGSPVAYYGGDFQPAILKEDGEVVFNGPYVQLFSPVAELIVKWILENRSENPGIEPGDMFLTNDPWIGATHQADVSLVAPVFHDGEIFCWLTNTLHQYDVGGKSPGSFVPNAASVFEEPVPIPPVKVVESGEVRHDIKQMYLRHSRMPNIVTLDFNAQVAGLNTTRQDIKELIDEYDPALVNGCMERIIEDSETRFLDKLADIPDGTWRTRTYEEGATIGDSELYPVTLQLTKDGDTLTFSNEGTNEGVGAVNLTYAGFRTAISCAVNPMMMYDQLWVHSGAYRHIEIEIDDDTISRASHPSGVSCGANLAAVLQIGLIYDVFTRMLSASDECRDDIIADPGAGILVPSQAGTNQWGQEFGTMNMDVGGVPIGARATKDGIDVGGYVFNPRGPLPNVEQTEQDYPVLYLYRRYATDFGGPGEQRGGTSMETAWIPHETDRIETLFAGSGGVTPNSTPIAGYPGGPGRVRVVEGTNVHAHLEAGETPLSLSEFENEPTDRHTKTEFVQNETDVVETRNPGTGGYGDPLQRDPEKVLVDVYQKEMVSTEVAYEQYGVVFDESGSTVTVDEPATEERRAEIVERRLAESVVPREED